VGLAHPSIAPYGVFDMQRGAPILISIQSDREWRKLCADILSAPGLGEDDRFATNVARVRNRAETDRIVAEAFAKVPSDEMARQLDKAGIAFAVLRDMEGLSRHPHLRRITVETEGGPVSLPAPGVIWESEVRGYGPVPALNAPDG
jgi:itaconate CoA-transferase